MREPERQITCGDRNLRRAQSTSHGMATFTFQDFVCKNVAFGNGSNVGTQGFGNARRFTAQTNRRDRYWKLQPDEMPALVKRCVAAAVVGSDLILPKAVAQILGVAFENHPDTLPNVIRNRPAVACQRRGDLDHSLMVEAAAIGTRPHDRGQILGAADGKIETPGRRIQITGVRDRRGFDGGLGAVQKRIEHFRIEPPAFSGLPADAPVIPDGLGR